MNLPVSFFSMTNSEHGHQRTRVVNFVENTVGSGANPPISFGIFQFFAPWWARIVRKRQHLLLDLLIKRRRNGPVVFLGYRQNKNRVLHLRLRRFSSRACPKGIGVSPWAFASSHARMSSRSSSSSRIFSYSSMLKTTAIFSPFSLVRNCVGAFIVSPIPEAYSSFRPSATTPAESVR